MNCQDIQKFAFTYLDCEFDGRERGEFETHLRLCCPCKAAVERDALFREIVRTHLDMPAPPEHVRDRLKARIACAHNRRVSRTVIVPVALAAGAAIALVGWRYLPDDQAQPGATPAAAIAGIPLGRQSNPSLAANPQREVTIANATAQNRAVSAKKSAEYDRLRQEAMKAPVQVRTASRTEPQVHPQAGFQLASNTTVEPAEVLRGGLAPSALTNQGPFGAVRSEESLRAMARVHVAQLFPEVAGSPTRVQKYLAARVPGIGPLPVSVGAGVDLLGARLVMIGAQPVVVYTYRAWGVPLTVISRAANHHAYEDSEQEATGPDARLQSGILLDRRGELSLMHVVSNDRVLTLVSELGPHAMLQLLP